MTKPLECPKYGRPSTGTIHFEEREIDGDSAAVLGICPARPRTKQGRPISGSPDATGKMAEINMAYETLCDSQRRCEYDLENDSAVDEEVSVEEDEGIGQEPQAFGRCIKCNFVNNSGVFVCSTCGHVFDPEVGRRKDDYGELDDG